MSKPHDIFWCHDYPGEALAEIDRLKEYARRIEDAFIALGAVISPEEEDRARNHIAAERACFPTTEVVAEKAARPFCGYDLCPNRPQQR